MTISNGVRNLTRVVYGAFFVATLLLSSNVGVAFAVGTQTAVADAYSTNEDTPLTIPANGVLGNDTPGANTLTAELETNVTHGSLVLSPDGSFVYTPNANYAGPDSFTYFAKDSIDGLSATSATVSITVDPIDDAPIADDESFSTDVDIAIVGQTGLLDGDLDPDTGAVLSAVEVLSGTSVHGTYSITTAGTFSYTPDPNYSGSDSFDYTVTDGSLFDTGTVTITVNKRAQTISFIDPADQTYGNVASIVLDPNPTASSNLSVTVTTTGPCSASGFTINILGAGTCAVTVSQPGNAVYAAATPVTQSFVIAPRAITVTAVTANKVYDGDTSSVGVPTLTSGTLASGDVAVYTQTYADANVGNGVALAPLATINGDGANANYAITYIPASGNITPASLTATAIAANKVYDGSTSASVVVSVGGLGGDDVQATYTAASFDTKDAGLDKTVTVTGIVLSGLDSGNYTLTSTQATDTADIARKALSVEVSVADKTYDNTTSATITGYSPAGLVGAETVTITGGVATFADNEHVGVAKPVSITGLSLVADTVSANYDFTTTDTTTASITARAITVTAQSNSKVYDGLDSSTTNAAVTSVTGLAAGDTATFTQTYDTIDVGTALAISPTATDMVNDDNGGANYLVTYVPANVGVITKASLTITADDKTRVYGDANPAATATYTGFVAGEDESYLDTPVTLVMNASSHSDVGDYAITAFGATSGNYDISHVNGNMAITKRPLTVTAVANNKVYDGTSAATVTLTPVGVLFTDSVTATYTGATFDTKDVGTGKTVTAAGVALAGVDSGNYTVATTATATADITALPLTVTAVASSKVYGGTDPSFTYTDSGLMAGDSFSGSLSRASGENVGTYAITQGTLTAGTNYTTTYVGANFSVSPATLTATANNATRVYGSANPTLTVSYTGFQNGDDEGDLDTVATASTLATISSSVGSYAITISGASDANYTLSHTAGTLTVTQASQAITFAALSGKNFGDADFSVSATADSGLTVAFAASGACTLSGTTVHLTTKGTCTITASQTGDTNWSSAADVVQSFSVADTVAPVITLIGDTTLTILRGSTYLDSGATATDDVDGTLTSSIVKDSGVDVFTLGTYTVTYNVSDSSGNAAAQVTRTVSVIGPSGGGGRSSQSINATTPTPLGRVLGAASYNFAANLALGARGTDVTELQRVLISAGFLNIAAPTGFFGPQTRSAVRQYQTARAITPATGFVGPLTRAALHAEGTPTKSVAAQIAELTAQLKQLQAKLGQ